MQGCDLSKVVKNSTKIHTSKITQFALKGTISCGHIPYKDGVKGSSPFQPIFTNKTPKMLLKVQTAKYCRDVRYG